MDRPVTLLVFVVDEQRYALPLASVRRVIFAVQVSRLAEGPSCLLGVVDVQGDVVPVLDIGRRGSRSRVVGVSDYFVLVDSPVGFVALVAHDVIGVVEPSSLLGPPAQVLPGIERFGGAISLDHDLVLIKDMGKFLTEQERLALEHAVEQAAEARSAH